MNKEVRIFLLFLSLLFIFSATKSNADIYSWVDEKGVTHYSSTPPQSDTDLQVEVLKSDKPATTTPKSPIENIKSTLKSIVTPAPTPTTITPAPQKDQSQRPKVELYITSWCPWCTKAQKFFQSKNVDLVTYDIEKDKEAAKRKRQLDKQGGVPFAVVNGHYIHGYNEAGYNNALKQ